MPCSRWNSNSRPRCRARAREHRIARQAALLGALDLAVPVGALHQPHVERAPRLAGNPDQVAQHRGRALLVGLYREPEAGPALEARVPAGNREQVEREFQPLRLFGVERERDAGVARRHAEIDEARPEFREHALTVRTFEARVQGRQLHRDARPLGGVRVLTGAALQCADGTAVGLEIPVGVGAGQGRLAQHVEGVAITAVVAFQRIVERLGDGPAHHELVAHDAHGLAHRGAHHRLAHPPHHAGHGTGRHRDVARVEPHQATGEHQAPGRGVDEQRLALAEVARPVPCLELVGDQAVGSLVVRYPQQRLGEAHQDHAFLRRQVVLPQEGVEARLAGWRRANGFHEALRGALHLGGPGIVEPRRARQGAHDPLFVGEEIAVDGPTDGRVEIACVAEQEPRRRRLAGGWLGHGVGLLQLVDQAERGERIGLVEARRHVRVVSDLVANPQP